MSFVILRQGVGLLGGAFAEMTDAGISTRSRDKLVHALDPVLRGAIDGDVSAGPRVLAIKELRAKRAGSLMSVDLTVDVPAAATVLAASQLEGKITQLLKDARKEVSEVKVKFHPVEDDLS